MFSVAIDGPSGAGKSSYAKELAERLGFLYVDTGALYRAIGLYVARRGKDAQEEAEVKPLLSSIHLSLQYVNGEQRVFLGDEDVSEEIRRDDISMAASRVSAHPSVREFLLETQRRLARESNVLMDGRDIGTVVLPRADVKIFLTADVEERAARRVKQLREKGMQADYETVKADVLRRDYNDSHRKIAPLAQAEDAILVDTTKLNYEEGVEMLYRIIMERYEKKRA